MIEQAQRVQEKFFQLFKENPIIIRSPGRINLIGEHTDYNLGFVLPAAIDKAICFAILPRDDDICYIHAIDLNDTIQNRVSNIEHQEKKWANYLFGVVDQIKKFGCSIKGFNCVFGGDIPIGAGLSSSAAIETGLAFSLNHIFNLGIENLELVKLSQRAENDFVGVNCGIMDQFINVYGKAKQVLKLDCKSLEYTFYPFDNEYFQLVLVNTMVHHSLASSEYNIRRSQCEAGVKIFRNYYKDIESLRDVETALLNQLQTKFGSIIYKRCKYVIEEIERVNMACNDLINKDFISFGKKMYETHIGLSKEYEVSCPELDFLVENAAEKDYVLGARMMGGGFGGCTINLVNSESINYFRKDILAKYEKKFSLSPRIYVCKIVNGTNIISDISNKSTNVGI
jgi:galactokinase